MIKKTLKTGLFIIAVASFSFISAQEKMEVKKDKSAKMFNHIDANADNTITLEEFKAKRMKDESKKAQVEKRFNNLDTDANGTLDRKEFAVLFEQNRKSKQLKSENKLQKKSKS